MERYEELMQKRKIASNIILFLFLILVSLTAIFSEIFQKPTKITTELIEHAKLFTEADVGQTKQISLKNKSGEYLFEKKENDQTSSWQMVAPREISANSFFIEKLFNALTAIKVKKILPDQPINNSNFSLDKPTANLRLIDQNGKAINIQVGLMNTIDNSTYLKVSGRDGIYHVEAPSPSLENVTILDLIESQVISIDLKTIISLKISHNQKTVFEIRNKDGNWLDSENNQLTTEKLNDYFQELSDLKSSFILDKQTEAQTKQIHSLVKNAEYTLTIEDNQKNSTEYRISGIIKSLSDVDLKNEEYFVVTTSSSSTAYVVKKEFLEILNKKTDLFREPIIKN